MQYSQQSPQRTQPITQQPPNIRFEQLSLQFNENPNNDNNQDGLQNLNPILDTQSTAHTVNSNALVIPVRRVEEQNIEDTQSDTQDLIQGSSTLSTTNTTKTQPPIQPQTPRNYDPPPLPEYETYTFSSTSHQPSSSNTNINGLINTTRPRFTFQSPPTPESTSFITHPYTQAQNTSDPNIPTTFNVNMILTNLPPNIVTSKTLSRPPIQIIPNNPLQYTLSSTNTHTTQNSIQSLENNTQTIASNNYVQHHNVSVLSRSSIRTNPYFTPISKIPTNANSSQTNTTHSNYQITNPYAQPSTTISNPTYINSSASISEPIQPFDGLDHKYTPEEHLQHMEARVTFL